MASASVSEAAKYIIHWKEKKIFFIRVSSSHIIMITDNLKKKKRLIKFYGKHI